ncbi:MAG: hypothetical protein IJK24_04650 [Oscillospiraceae bacterium]|nr:hypothetical protein [Oscillospiraceae bacterium]
MENHFELIDNYLKVCSGKAIDVFYELYQFVEPLDFAKQASAIKYICEKVEEIDSDFSYTAKSHFSELQYSKIDIKFQKKNLLQKISALTISSSINAEDPCVFYEKLWSLVIKLTSKTTRERALALYMLSRSELIPYRPIGTGISMEDEEYRRILRNLDPSLIDNVEYIVKLHYDQKTQFSSLLLDWLLSINGRESQVVFLSIILNNIKRTTKRNIQEAIENAD